MTTPKLIVPLLLALGIFISCRSDAPTPPQAPRATVRTIDPVRIARAEAEIEAAIARDEIPGAALVIGDSNGVLYRSAFGRRVINSAEPLASDTVFDLASLTKPIATATCIAILMDDGLLSPADLVADHVPAFAANGKAGVTIEQLLLHNSGFIPDNAIADYEQGAAEAIQRICNLSPRWEPGKEFHYSDVGYIMLGHLVHELSGKPLDQFFAQRVAAPLRMDRTRFVPPMDWQTFITPTEQERGGWIHGRVHDPRAARMDGVAGHAGLFSHADDLARYCRMILNGGQLDGVRILREQTVREMTMPRFAGPGAVRTHGFDVATAYSSCRGQRFTSGQSFGHTGFTGTMLWIDPVADAFVILLTSRLQMPDGGKTRLLRHMVSTYAAEAVAGVDPQRVLTGIDVLNDSGFDALKDQRIGLITNHTGQDRFGRRTIDLLHEAKDVNLVAIFSPEHGIAGKLDEDGIGDAKDEQTSLPIFSLYGQTRRPTPRMLEQIDTIVFDIQDIGTRFYTYITTMGYAMEEAAKHGKRFVVLDRPNPIGPLGVRGPMAEADDLSFIAYKPLPLVHGMTIGELARYFKAVYMPNLELHVVPMQHYRRGLWWDQTQVQWVNPSPNMRNPTQALLYPGIGLLEASNLSVGRGTPAPFERFGAPWIDGPQFATALNAHGMPGVRFDPLVFTPDSSKYASERCEGVRITVTDRSMVQPVEMGFAIAWTLKRMYGEQWEFEKVKRMVASDAAHAAWQSATDAKHLKAFPALQTPGSFIETRRRYLIYPE